MKKEGNTGEGERDFEVRFLGLDDLLITRVDKKQDWDDSYNQATRRMGTGDPKGSGRGGGEKLGKCKMFLLS